MQLSTVVLQRALLLLFAVACGSGDPSSDRSTAAASGGAGAAGRVASGGGSGAASVTLAGSGQAVGDGDPGTLFGPDGAVPLMAPEQVAGMNGGGTGPVGALGDGNTATSTIRGAIAGRAVFTQTAEDVTVVVELNGCPDGSHQFRIHDGYSCDNSSTEGLLWGARGSGIGDNGVACAGGKGTLTYTRTGADKTKNWTVADHNLETDVTAHVVIVSDAADPNSRVSCGNFF